MKEARHRSLIGGPFLVFYYSWKGSYHDNSNDICPCIGGDQFSFHRNQCSRFMAGEKRSAVTEGTITAIFNDNGTAKGNRGRWAKVKFKLNGKTYYPEDRLPVSDLAEPGDPISLRYDKEKPTVLYRYSLFRLGGSGLICFFAVLYFVINLLR